MSYENFAYYYDSLMDESFYEDYYQFIKANAKYKSVLELGCGTGETAIKLAKDDVEIYATDLSKDMLEVARAKAQDNNVTLLLGRIDMTDFQVDRQVDLILCLCDSLNYLFTTKQVKDTFKNVYNALKKNGTFIFDVNSLYKCDVTLKNYHEVQEDDEFSFSWKVENVDSGYIKHYIDIVDKAENDEVHEQHVQKTYSVDTYQKMLKKAGFESVTLFSDFAEYKEECQRVIFVCKKEK